ncbi:MAG: glutamine--fructose-6-phosphate transaminase (isomerizing) [Pirellulaceae bacterium]|nr:glutamine--fructose-6-phosphate transaminase (isomerizing) [Pirellulaceae bacterium]
MCGIMGYVGHRGASERLLEGLRRLEYRGYDSAGLATLGSGHALHVRKQAGRIAELASDVAARPAGGSTGIAHTRWATHGAATRQNAHPHLGGNGVLALAHNGVIENFQPLKEHLQTAGFQFRSETDSEVIAHLVAEGLRAQQRELAGTPAADVYESLVRAVSGALSQLRGTYGVALVFRDWPELIIAARLGSPLVVGVGQGEHYLASDGAALAPFTDKIVYLADHQIAVVTPDRLRVVQRDGATVRHGVERLVAGQEDGGLDGYPHYMLKEICEQPRSLTNALRGRLNDDDATAVFGGLNLTPQQLRRVKRIILTACGTSWHAALVGEYLIEELARIPVEVEYASELRYRNPPLGEDTLLFAVTQSGETADTLAALREMKRKGLHTLAICNVVGSTISHEADGGIYLHAGPEIGVASTKAFTSQCAVLALLALYLGRLNDLSFARGTRIIEALRRLPEQVETALETDAQVRELAARYGSARNFLYLGRQINFPTALEGALKLKEISYLHAEGYPAAEMKHGPIALVDQDTPAVFLVPRDSVYDKVRSNIQEVRARGGPVIAVGTAGDRELPQLADDVILVPAVEDFLTPLVHVIPLQLLAYHIAVSRGCDVDKPRNLAKSVTVE